MANTTNIGNFIENPQSIGRKTRAFDVLRRMAQKIALEQIDKADWPLVRTTNPVVLAEAILYTWGYSHDAALEKMFLEIAYGKPPVETRISGPEGEPLIPPSSGFDLSRLSVNELVALRNSMLKAQGVPEQEIKEEELVEQQEVIKAENTQIAFEFLHE
jgi:hypothetical protein